MKNKNQLLYTIVGFFVIFGLVISMNSKTAFAEDGKVFYLDDLKVGDFIPNDSTLIVGDNYVDSAWNIKQIVEVNINYYYPYNAEFFLNAGEVYTMKRYNDYIDDSPKNFDGWRVKNFFYSDYYTVELEPIKLDEIDSEENVIFSESDIEVKLTCKDNSEPTYKWYKVAEIDDLQIDTYNKWLWNEENGVYSYSLNNYVTTNDLTSSITLKFNAYENDILSFDYRRNESLLYYSLNGVDASLDIDNKNAYNNARIGVTNSGSNEIVLYDLMNKGEWYEDDLYVYDDYFYLKNIRVLSPLNEGSKLDTSKVSNGDEIYYECNCDSGYKYSNSFRYGIDDSISGDEGTKENISKSNSVDKNPQTYSTVIYVLSIIFVIGFSIFINREKIFRKDS